jgi:hypothetical protein
MTAAVENMGSTVPQFVKDELLLYLTAAQNTACNNDNGGFAYTYIGSTHWFNITKAAAGVICLQFCDVPLTDPRIQSAIGYMYRHWGEYQGGWEDVLYGNSYAMYAMMKSMRIPEPDILMVTNYDCSIPGQTAESFDWYYRPVTPQPTLPNNGATQQGLATYLVNAQQADGQWDDTTGNNKVYNALATGWGVLILLKGVAIIPPVAQICDCGDLEADLNQDIHLDGSCSYHPDQARSIVSYEWDFDNDGQFDDASGITATITGGFNSTGYYPVGLRVTDNNPVGMGGPQTDTVVCEVYVHPPCLDPQADANGPYIGTPGNPVQLDASGTTDPDTDNANLTFECDLDNDGQFDDAVGINPTHTWGSEYTGVIGLKVSDTCDAQVPPEEMPWYTGEDIDYTTIVISDNHPPVSDPNGPYMGSAGDTINLDGTGSYDPDSDNITYAWDLDNDGNFDDSVNPQPSFSIPGGASPGSVYPVCLRVEDDSGLYDIACTSVTVEAGPEEPEVGGTVQPTNKFILLIPLITLGILLTAWSTMIMRRRRVQS